MTATTKTYVLMAGLTALFGVIGAMIAGTNGMMVALAFAAATNIFSYWNADKIVLRLYKARQIDAVTAPDYYRVVQNLATRAHLPMPKFYIIDQDQPNAFATGRNPQNAAVAATSGLINRLTLDELGGVMAHELAHVKNRDTLTMTVAATMAGAISALANFARFFGHRGGNGNTTRGASPLVIMLFSLLAPLAAMLVQMAISRTREYEADRIGAEICGNPAALARALEKIAGGTQATRNIAAETHPATAHMFIINPLHRGMLQNLFTTHPRTEERIRRLMDMAVLTDAERADPFAAPGFDTFSQGPKNPWDRAA